MCGSQGDVNIVSAALTLKHGSEGSGMKERHWNTLVTSIRHGDCILVLGPEIPADNLDAADAGKRSFVDALTAALATELVEDDPRRRTGTTLAAVAQQYEDAEGFGPMRFGQWPRGSTNRRNSGHRRSMPPSRSCLSA